MLKINFFKKGSALILSVILFMTLLASGSALLMTGTAHYKSNRTYRALISSQYSARGALGIVAYILNTTDGDEITRIEGKLDNWESIIYTKNDGLWKQLKSGATVNGAGGDPSADDTFKLKDTSLKLRGNNHFRVIVEKNGTLGYKAHASASYDREGYAITGYFTSRKLASESSAVTGYDQVYIKENGVIDSYNSQGGTVPYSTTNMNSAGDVGSNGNIVLDGDQTTMVYGNVTPGPGKAVLGDITQVAPLKSTTARTTPITVPSELDTDWLLEPTLGKFGEDKTGETLLTSSVHYESISFKNTIKVQGDVTIYCHGNFTANAQGLLEIMPGSKLTLYVNGNFSYNGGFKTSSTNPLDFVVKCTKDEKNTVPDPETGSGYNIKVNGDSAIVGIIDAPFANVQLTGGAQIFGAVTGYRVLVGGSSNDGLPPHDAKVHYDESLGSMGNQKNYFFLNSTLKAPFKDTP